MRETGISHDWQLMGKLEWFCITSQHLGIHLHTDGAKPFHIMQSSQLPIHDINSSQRKYWLITAQ